MKKILNNFFLVIASSIIALFLIELGFRIYTHKIGFSYVTAAKSIINYDRFPEGLYESNGGWGLNPNFSAIAITSDFQVLYKINNLGFRGENFYQDNKKKDVVSIVALGDSFTFGEGVPLEGTYVGKIDKSLAEINVYNLGVPGHSLDATVNTYVKYEHSLNPDIVILFINELMIRRSRWLLSPNETTADNINSDQKTIYLSKDSSHLFLPQIKLFNNLELYQFFQYKFSLYFLTEDMYQKDNKIWDQVRKRNQIDETEKQFDQTRQELDDVLWRHLIKLRDETEKRGDLLVVVNIDVNKISQRNIQSELELKYLDLSEEISAYQTEVGPIRFKIDHHYNSRAHQLIYELLQPKIKDIVDSLAPKI